MTNDSLEIKITKKGWLTWNLSLMDHSGTVYVNRRVFGTSDHAVKTAFKWLDQENSL